MIESLSYGRPDATLNEHEGNIRLPKLRLLNPCEGWQHRPLWLCHAHEVFSSPLDAGDGVKEIIEEALAMLTVLVCAMNSVPCHCDPGEPEKVLDVILSCHRRALELAPRVLTNITLVDRQDATGRRQGKVRDVGKIRGTRLSRV